MQPGTELCVDACSEWTWDASVGEPVNSIYHDDGHCDDGGDGSAFAVCAFGTDCADCGKRLLDCMIECEDATTETAARAMRNDARRRGLGRQALLGLALGRHGRPLVDVDPDRHACRCTPFVPFAPPSPPVPAAVAAAAVAAAAVSAAIASVAAAVSAAAQPAGVFSRPAPRSLLRGR